MEGPDGAVLHLLLDTLWGVYCDECHKGLATKNDSLMDAALGDECIHESARPAKLQSLAQSGSACSTSNLLLFQWAITCLMA